MRHRLLLRAGLLASFVLFAGVASSAEQPNVFAPVDDREPFAETMRRMSAQKESVEAAHRKLLEARYDLADKPSSTVKMSRGKPVQTGVRVKLPSGVTWQSLGTMSAADIKGRNAWPAGFMPLPHPNHPEGGMLFPKSHIDW